MNQNIFPLKYYYGKDFFSNQSLPLEIIHMDCSTDYPPHSHDFIELVVVYSGKALHTINSRKMIIQSGDVLVIPKNCQHSYMNVKKLSYVNIIFDLEVITKKILMNKDFYKNLGVFYSYNQFMYIHLPAFETQQILSLINKIDGELYRSELNYEIIALAYFMSLLVYLNRASYHSGNKDDSTDTRVRRVIERIKNNISVSFSVEEMSEIAITSSRNFRRKFKEITGKTPTNFVTDLRIEESAKLLVNTDLTITQIAFLVGFEDSNYYSYTFKRIKGIAPSAFRKTGT